MEQLIKSQIGGGVPGKINEEDEQDDEAVDDQNLAPDSAVSGFGDDESASLLPTTGKSRYDTLIKSLIARIEFNNTLAPIQEYGRHQKRAANIKKKNKKKTAINPNEQSEDPSENPKFDENFYDLDDDFIDDGELEDIQQYEDDMMLYVDQETSKFMSGPNSELPKIREGDENDSR